ncbi:MAG: hypothetical protein H6559_29385 [Lewinellaceae bacterium]|nr:hypothetical protein [Lewinellaceae bacterium]
MERYIIELKDLSKRTFFLELLSQLDFIDFKIREEEEEEPVTEKDYDFFQSAGLFVNREINANQLRKEAWRIPS